MELSLKKDYGSKQLHVVFGFCRVARTDCSVGWARSEHLVYWAQWTNGLAPFHRGNTFFLHIAQHVEVLCGPKARPTAEVRVTEPRVAYRLDKSI